MSIRSDILEQFGLPDVPAFAIEKCTDPQGLLRIKFSCDGRVDNLCSIGVAAKLAQMLRDVDADLADQIEACLQEV